MWAEWLYLTHTLLEVVLGALKLRGRYAHEKPLLKPARSQMYVRHHGFSLLAHALLGALVLHRGGVQTEMGEIASLVLATFHGGAVIAFLHAWASGGIPAIKVLVPHAPYAVAFAVHALNR